MHTKNNMLIFVIIGFLCFFSLAGTGNARVITVGHTLGADYWNIQNAIDESNEGDLIQVWYGTYNENIVINKSLTVESRDGASYTFIDGMGSGIVVNIASDNVILKGFTVQNGKIGVQLKGKDSEGIVNCKIISNSIRHIAGVGDGEYAYGIYVTSADNIIINANTVSDIKGRYSNDSLYGCAKNGGDGIGIFLNMATEVRLLNNNISDVGGGSGGNSSPWYGNCRNYYAGSGGNGYGICIASSSDNLVNKNTVSEAHRSGAGSGMNVQGLPGKGYGIAAISATERNIIYKNNFKDNDTQDGYDSGGNNAWDAGPGIGGNYWSDYQGTDDDGDGIGDKPYELAGGIGAKDFFPLIEPLSCEGDFDGDQDVDGSDLATFAAGGTTITLEEFATEFGRTDCPLYSDQLIAHR